MVIFIGGISNAQPCENKNPSTKTFSVIIDSPDEPLVIDFNDRGFSGIEDSNGGEFLITGDTYGYVTQDVLVNKLDGTGTVIDSRVCGTNFENEAALWMNEISPNPQTPSGGYIYTGYTGTAPNRDLLLKATDKTTGLLGYAQLFGNNNQADEIGRCVIQDSFGDYVAVGVRRQGSGATKTIFAAGVSQNFSTVKWVMEYFIQGADEAFSVTEISGLSDPNGMPVYGITGKSDKQVFLLLVNASNGLPHGGLDAFLYDLDNNPSTQETAYSIMVDPAGDILLAGGAQLPLPNPAPPVSPEEQIFVLKTSLNTNFLPSWINYYNILNSKKEFARHITMGKDQNYILTGIQKVSNALIANPPGGGELPKSGQSYLLSLDINGSVNWCNEYFDLGYDGSGGYRVEPVSTGGYFMSGEIWDYVNGLNRNYHNQFAVCTDNGGLLYDCECCAPLEVEIIDHHTQYLQKPVDYITQPKPDIWWDYGSDSVDVVATYCDRYCPSDTLDFKCGEAVITCYSGSDPSGHVMGIKNVRDKSGAPLGANWLPPVYMHPDWVVERMGEVFGVAIDNSNNIYLTATSVYLSTSIGSAGNGGIYRADGNTGNISDFASLPNSPGVGLGNICYDKRNDQFFVTNFEDGKIYRLSSSGVIQSSFDPFSPDNGINGCAPIGEILWGVGIYKNTVYFGRWNNDLFNSGVGQNEIYAINLDCNGEFDFADGANLEIKMPVYPGNSTSSPVSDIAFAEDGRMLLAERTQIYCSNNNGAHNARVLEYSFSGSTWNFDQEFFIGNYSFHRNSAGGVDYGYDDFLLNAPPPLPKCDAYVWATGDALVLSGGVGIYGVAGIPSSGNSPAPSPNAPLNSIYIDADGDTSDGGADKTQIGDVEIFKCGDCCELSCDSLDVSLTSTLLQGDSCCYQIDIVNNYCNDIISFEAEVLTTGWQFNTASLNINAGWNGTPFPNKIKVDYNDGIYPCGATNNLMTFCLINNVQNPPPPSTQTIKFTWYELDGCDTLAVCETIKETFCEPKDPPPPPCVELVDIDISCDTIPGVYKMTFFVSNFNPIHTATNLLLHSPTSPIMYFRDSPAGTNFTGLTIPVNVPPITSNGPYTVYLYSATPITSTTNVYFKIGLINSQFCCHPPEPVCVQLEPCACIETHIDEFICVPDSNKYRLTFTITNRSTIAPDATGLFIDVKNAPYFVPTNFFDWTTNPLSLNSSRTITTCVEPFPITDPHLILEYTIHHSLIFPYDTCCTSAILDTIPIPNCNPCPPIIVKNDVPILDGIYHAAQTVESAGAVPSTGNVHFKAGQNIRLNTGFSVATGATFSANIEPCCCSDDPLNDLSWLQPFIGDANYSISRGVYQNQCVFIVTDFCVVSDGVTAYYNCEGNKICESYQIGTTCPAGFTVQNITVLQGC